MKNKEKLPQDEEKISIVIFFYKKWIILQPWKALT